MPQPSAAIPPEWGTLALRRAREAQGLSRPDLAERSGVPASTIAKLEHGTHAPTHRTLARLCDALELPSPLPGAELRIALGPIASETALATLTQALREYIAARTDPEAFAGRSLVSPPDRPLVTFEAIGQRETAKQLLAQLEQGPDMTDPAPENHRSRWRSRREDAEMTQEELATRAGLSLRKLKAIEAGRETPSPKEERALDAVIKEGPARR